ncbi:hypothetical protein KVT40_006873 [Elsinoe batatas]|uniref:NACHT domain-containing protein n=1 Tax=Elsinoe batatas TaxID=2601811 RepID=A0A8K0KX36_9PEZI|nr:hypothetical protein KVT40_006873 [Elsinoe batatas]
MERICSSGRSGVCGFSASTPSSKSSRSRTDSACRTRETWVQPKIAGRFVSFAHISQVQSQSNRVEQRLDMETQGKQDAKCRKWLNPVDPSTNDNAASSKRSGTSGEWLLRSREFREWRSSSSKTFLWLHGISGCGKTVLSSTIISHLRDSNVGHGNVLFFYFDFADSDKQTLEAAIRSLLIQLVADDSNRMEKLRSLRKDHADGQRQPPLARLCETFAKLIGNAGTTWIVLDALDECTTRYGDPSSGLLEWLNSIYSNTKDLHLLVTSRPGNDIRKSLLKWARSWQVLALEGTGIDHDINAYVSTLLKEHPAFERWRSRADLKDLILQTLSRKAAGMFRWVSCRLDALGDCVDPRSLRRTLEKLPRTLHATYDRMLEQARQGENWEMALRLIRFLLYTPRPLSVDEAADLLTVDIEGDVGVHLDNLMPHSGEIISLCPGLVTINIADKPLPLAESLRPQCISRETTAT